MKLSPLQFESYVLTDLTFRARQDFIPNKELKFTESDLAVIPDVHPIKDQPRRWQVGLSIKLQPSPGTNSPYELSISLVGIIWVAPQLPLEKLDELVRTNGPSMLYGVAREMVRDLTARGPFLALVLPSVSFIPDMAAQEVRKATESGEQAINKPTSEPDSPQTKR